MKKFLIIIAIIIVAAGAGYYFIIWENNQQTDQPTPQAPDDNDDWVTYTNNQYDFTLSHPPDWEVAEFTSGLVLGINIYKPDVSTTTLSQPLIHHDNATFVGIFPDGIGTEGILGQTRNSSINFREDTTQAFDYVL